MSQVILPNTFLQRERERRVTTHLRSLRRASLVRRPRLWKESQLSSHRLHGDLGVSGKYQFAEVTSTESHGTP